jgi:hypothetical protein
MDVRDEVTRLHLDDVSERIVRILEEAAPKPAEAA